MRFEIFNKTNQPTVEVKNEIQRILELAFPESERRTAKDQLFLLENNENFNCVGLFDKDFFVGFITYFDFENFEYYEHFAVNPDFRGAGFGQMTMDFIIKNSKKPIIFEVEPMEDEITTRRAKFYMRQGFKYCENISYIQPPYQKNQKGIPLIIMTNINDLTEESFYPYKKVLYKQVHNLDI